MLSTLGKIATWKKLIPLLAVLSIGISHPTWASDHSEFESFRDSYRIIPGLAENEKLIITEETELDKAVHKAVSDTELGQLIENVNLGNKESLREVIRLLM